MLGFFVDGNPLFELEVGLDDVLSHLAFEEVNRGYVAGVKRRLRGYKALVDSQLMITGISQDSESGIVVALSGIGNAYRDFMGCSWARMSDEEMQEAAEEILRENNFIGGETIPTTCEIRRRERLASGSFGWTIYSDGVCEVFEHAGII